MLEKQPNTSNQKTGNWDREGDFSSIYDSGSSLNRCVTYRNTNGTELTLCGYKNSDLRIRLTIPENGSLTRLMEKFKKEGFTVIKLIDSFSFTSDDRKKIANFLNSLDSNISISSIKKEIFVTLNLNQILDQTEFFKELIKLLEENNVDGAVKMAKSFENDDVLYRLGQYCEEQNKFPEALNIYQEIPQDNPHYKEANLRALDIIIQYQTNSNEILPTQEKRELEESKVKFMLRSNTGQYTQDLLDQHYYQLSGGNDLSPSVKNIKCDEDTLINLSRDAYSLREENRNLQERNIKLEQKIALLEDQLKKSKNNESTYPKTFFNADDSSDIEEKKSTYMSNNNM